MTNGLATRLLRAVDTHGVLLVHDRVLPSITSIAVGEPVSGSWWAHPLANEIYNALSQIEHEVLNVKLIRGKDTLIARRLWPSMLAIGMQQAEWQMRGLDDASLEVLKTIEAAGASLVVSTTDRKQAGTLAERLLVHATGVHLPSGKHAKAYESWDRWAARAQVQPGRAANSTSNIEATVATSLGGPQLRLLPWPTVNSEDRASSAS